MSSNAAIASAIATRFAGLVAPTGYPAIVTATYRLPQGINGTPTVLVFPPGETFGYVPGQKREGTQEWPVRFYIAPYGDIAGSWDAIYAWRDVLLEALVGQYQLGLAPDVEWARLESISPAWRLPYGDTDYLGLELVVLVTLADMTTPVA